MTTLIMTSPKIEGHIQLDYNEAGALERLHIAGALTQKQYEFFMPLLPWHAGMIESFRAKAPQASFVLRDRKLTFIEFWDRYDDKIRSSKKRTEKAWNALSEADQIRAYLHYPKYMRHKGAAEKMYAETYLSKELWNN